MGIGSFASPAFLKLMLPQAEAIFEKFLNDPDTPAEVAETGKAFRAAMERWMKDKDAQKKEHAHA